jgi:hypothetical protein
MPGPQLRLKPLEFRRASVREQFRQGRQGDIHKARTAPAPAGADTGCVDANGPKQSLDFAGPLITETPKLQAVSANTGGKFLHLGLKDQTTKFAEQVLPFRQHHAHLLCRKPRDPPIEPANLDRLHLSPAVSGLEVDHPLHDRLLPTEEPIFPIQRCADQNFSTPRMELTTRKSQKGRIPPL